MTKSLVVIPDIHFPYQHTRAVNALLDFCEDKLPDKAVQLGDAYDFFRLTTFHKPANAGMSVYKEVLAGKKFWERLCAASKEVHFMEGNHEARFQRQILDAHPDLAGHPAMELKKLLLLPDKVKVYPSGAKLVIDNILICHGDHLAGTKAKFPAANVLNKYPNQHTVFGHLHRIDSAIRTVVNYDKSRTYMSRCIGWLGDQSKEAFHYAPDANWQLGFLWVEFMSPGRFTAHQIEMVDGRFSFDGKTYG